MRGKLNRCLAAIAVCILAGLYLAAGPGTPRAAAAAPAGWSPANLRSAYGLQSVTSGLGMTVAVVTAYDDPDAESDLGVYRTQYGLPACTTANGCFSKVNQTGGSTYPPAGWSGQDAESLDAISAVCPNCHITLVEATSSAITDLGTAENEAVALGTTFIDNDWSIPEAEIGATETSYDALYFNHPGVAITAPAGDSGYGVSYPAASPYVIAVGGTVLTQDASTARGWDETAWADSGSGCSAYEAKPAWQTDTGCTGRTDNDIAAAATNLAYYDTPAAGGWSTGSGTEISAAIIAAALALTGPPAAGTYPAAALYAQPGNLNDITTGSDGTCPVSYLCTAGTGYDGPTGLGTPSQGGDTLAIAFQANTGDLWIYTATNAGSRNTGLGMDTSSSPSITATSTGSYEVAFEADTNILYYYTPTNAGSRDTGLAMKPGTSPSIAVLANGTTEIAFQSNTGHLYLTNPGTGVSIDTGLGMDPDSSPSIVATWDGSYEVAFQANAGILYYYTPTNAGSRDTGLGMDPGTSPSIAAGPQIAFQANAGILYYYTPTNVGSRDTGLSMKAGTSPSIAVMADGTAETAFQSNAGHLCLTDQNDGISSDSGLGMDPGTSPSIAP
jgi:subtilase family serine protease